ncbi:Argininosuccinate lyase [bioreactor metagenome]|uniref:Argininosuccinate lyase n=1 Tax=bioreactor metagenome TaxID=1076179 RepID=A0A645JE13_9ZZZZ
MLAGSKFNKDIMARSARGGYTNATDLADYLAGKGLPFRDAHEVAGRTVLYCLSQKCALEDLSLEQLRQFSNLIEADIYQFIDINACVARRSIPGGPAPATVRKAIQEANEWMVKMKNDDQQI